ncbi:MAG TPA: glycoside hydrolase family 25 protein [Pyrinomonadaceae bacterium]|jgi:lysozyme|nr:glycoside hydrolase family 25 protein [Pyrinomonadaceae bacterium]
MSSIQGANVVIDLSHYNQVTSFPEIQQSGIVGVIHKATEGTNWSDPTYASRKPQALAAGLLWGAYHFGVNADGTAQAQYFLSFVKPGPQDLLALDFEENSSSQMTIAQAEQFVTEIYNQTGRYPGFYSDALAGNMLGSNQDSILANCWFWRAEYGGAAPSVPPTWSTWTMWQYTESGSVPGISGSCDRDTFNGSEADLSKLWGQSSAGTE